MLEMFSRGDVGCFDDGGLWQVGYVESCEVLVMSSCMRTNVFTVSEDAASVVRDDAASVVRDDAAARVRDDAAPRSAIVRRRDLRAGPLSVVPGEQARVTCGEIRSGLQPAARFRLTAAVCRHGDPPGTPNAGSIYFFFLNSNPNLELSPDTTASRQLPPG